MTALDWERLGVAALEELAFEVARKAFQRSENIVFLTLIDQLQVMRMLLSDRLLSHPRSESRVNNSSYAISS